jgi:hypothetical protein
MRFIQAIIRFLQAHHKSFLKPCPHDQLIHKYSLTSQIQIKAINNIRIAR